MAPDPEKAVLYGIARFAASQLSDADTNKLHSEVTDVVPIPLGIGIIDYTVTPKNKDKFKIFIPANTPLPAKARYDELSTTAPNQKAIDLTVYEGSKESASENQVLQEFTFSGFQPRKTLVHVTVQFDIDTSGILTVTAKHGSGRKAPSAQLVVSTGGKQVPPRGMSSRCFMYIYKVGSGV